MKIYQISHLLFFVEKILDCHVSDDQSVILSRWGGGVGTSQAYEIADVP